MVLDQDLVDVGAHRTARPGGSVEAIALDDQRRVGVGEYVELEVLVALRELVEAVERVRQRPRRVEAPHDEGGHGANGRRVDHAKRPEPYSRGEVDVAIALGRDLEHAPVREHELQRLDLGGEVAELAPGAVGGGRDRPGERLAVDVPEVLHRQAALPKRGAQVTQRDSGLDLDQAGVAVCFEHPVEPPDADHRALGERRLGERVPRAGGVGRQAALGGAANGGAQLLERSRLLHDGGRAALVPSPVPPLARHRSKPICRTECATDYALPCPEGWQSGRMRRP